MTEHNKARRATCNVPRWIGASTAAQRHGLTYDQVVQAVMMGIVHGSETGDGMLVNPVDVEAVQNCYIFVDKSDR